MSQRFASLSRRRLLRIASLTPVALLGFGSRTRAELKNLCESTIECSGVPVDSNQFFQVAANLWSKFEEGTGGKGVKAEVFQKAFEMSGPFVICNVNKFPADGNDPVTNRCCRRCGELAADYAPFWRSINADDFQRAWCDTGDELADSVLRTRMLDQDPRVADEHRSEDGMGCG